MMMVVFSWVFLISTFGPWLPVLKELFIDILKIFLEPSFTPLLLPSLGLLVLLIGVNFRLFIDVGHRLVTIDVFIVFLSVLRIDQCWVRPISMCNTIILTVWCRRRRFLSLGPSFWKGRSTSSTWCMHLLCLNWSHSILLPGFLTPYYCGSNTIKVGHGVTVSEWVLEETPIGVVIQ